MKLTTIVKNLALLGLTSLTLAAGSAHADSGYGYYGGNPWVNGPAYQQANYFAAMKQRQAQLDQHQDAQMQRILVGMEQGRVDMREAVRLLREHLEISNLERSYLADGHLGPNEIVSLEQRIAEADRHITFESNDRGPRGPMGPMGPVGPMGRPGDMDRR